MSGRKGEKSKNDTWGEQELSKYIGGGGKDTSKKRLTSTDPYGSPKSNPKARTSATSLSKKDQGHTGTSSSSRTSIRPDTKRTGTGGAKSSLESSKKPDSKSRLGGQSSKPDEGHKRREKEIIGGSKQRDSRDPKPSRSSTQSKPDSKSQGQSGSKPLADGSSRAKQPDRGRTKPTDSRSSQDKHGSSSQRRSGSKRNEEHSKKTSDKPREGRDGRTKDIKTTKSHSQKEQNGHSKGKTEKAEGGRKEEIAREDVQVPRPPVEEIDEHRSGYKGGGHANEEGHPQPMVEMIEDLGEEDYQYEDEFEEDYDEDFEEVEEEEEEENEHVHSSLSEGEVPTTPTNADVAVIPSALSKAVVMKAIDLVEIMQAIDAENQMVVDSTSSLLQHTALDRADESVYSEGEGVRGVYSGGVSGRGVHPSPSRRFVDFSSAQKREVNEKVAKKTRKRGQELLSLIELDIVVYDMFDLPPLSEYEVYVKKFGADDTRQVSVQTGEDNVDCEVQTEPVTTQEKWVQWPPEDLRGYGGPSVDEEGEEYKQAEVTGRVKGQSTFRLASFLKRAGQVCSVLLEENLLTSGVSPFHSTQSPFPFCSSSLTIQALPTLSDRHVTDISYCPTQDHLFLAAYSTPLGGPSGSSGDRGPLGRKGVVCVWNTREPRQPQMILVCQSTPSCCCFSPQKSSLAFAGNEDGSVVVWDLREPVSMHKRDSNTSDVGNSSGEKTLEVVSRVPTFSTAGITQLDNHQSPVVSIKPISADTPTSSSISHVVSLFNKERDDDDGGSTGLSFQLATLDRSGHMNIWVVIEIRVPDLHGSESDLGLVPGGRVKLVKSASIDIVAGPNNRTVDPLDAVGAHCLQFKPGDTSHLYVGTEMGNVLHHTRYGRRPIPRTYTSGRQGGSCDVLCVSFCPWQPDHFLAGCSDGSIRLHHINRDQPLLSWPSATIAGAAVTMLQWVHHRPGVFIVQDNQSTIYLWDLLKNDAEYVYKQIPKQRFSCCALQQGLIQYTITPSPSHEAHSSPTLTQHTSPHKAHGTSTLTLAHTDGTTVVHQLKDSGKNSEDKNLAFENYLNSLM